MTTSRRDQSPVSGDEAAIQAGYRADIMLEKGDTDDAAVWRRIVEAVKELLDTRPQNGAAPN